MKSIALKLWTGMMALVLIVLLLLWMFQIVFLGSFYNKIRITNIEKQGKKVIDILEKGNSSDFQNRLDQFAADNSISAQFVDISGNIVYEAGLAGMNGQIPMMMNSTKTQVFEDALSGKQTEITVTHPRFGNKFVFTGIPVKQSDAVSGALVLIIPMAAVEETAAILKKQLIYITLILLSASLVLSFVISKSFTRPILEIEKTADKMASGDFSARININQKDEIGKLSNTINYLGQELSKIEQLRKDLIANVSHELRTPLSVIRGYAETIRDVSGDVPQKRNGQLEIIIDETERLGRIVDDTLNLSQLQSGNYKLDLVKFKLDEFLSYAAGRYDILAEKKKICLKLESLYNGLVYADSLRIEQVVYNLLNNAFNHTPENGEISIRTKENDDIVKVEISDTGNGIPEEEIPYIWERYYKASGNNTVGTGLGLAIVKSILQAHGFEFGVSSIENIGTTFWFSIKKAL